PAQNRKLEGDEDLWIRYEVWTGDPDAFFRNLNRVSKKQRASVQVIRRSGWQHQNRLSAGFSLIHRPIQIRNLSCRPVPIVEKRELDCLRRWTRNGSERVAPRTEAPASTEVLVSDVHPPNESQAPVHNDDFPMIAEVDLEPKAQPTAGFERLSTDSTIAQLVNVPPRQRTGS